MAPSLRRALLLTAVVAAPLGCGGADRHGALLPTAPIAPAPQPPVTVATPAPEPTVATRADEPPPPAPLDWATVPLSSDADARAAWRAMRPTWGAWSDGHIELPPDDHGRALLATALLREGNLACGKVVRPGGTCAPEAAAFEEPDRQAGIDDPCFRRELASWALDQLDEGDADGIGDALVAIAGLPAPEEELIQQAFSLLPEHDDALALRMLAATMQAGHADLADDAVQWLSPTATVYAATHLHIAGALDHLDDKDDHRVALQVISEPGWPTAARITAMDDLGSDVRLGNDVRRALLRARQDPDCAVAAEAAVLLGNAGSKVAPSRPRSNDVPTLIHALCVLDHYASDDPSLLRGFVSAHGLAVVSIKQTPWSDTDDDGNGDPHTVQEVDAIPRGELLTLPLDDEAPTWTCTGDTCETPTQTIRFEFANERGALMLTRIYRSEKPLQTCETPPMGTGDLKESPRKIVEDPYRGRRLPK